MRKDMPTAIELYMKSFDLAKKIHESSYSPEIILMVMRGGAAVGVIVHEYLTKNGHKLDYETLKVTSYTSPENKEEVIIHQPKLINEIKGKNILIVDDILDTGATLKAIKDQIGKQAKIAVIYYKPKSNETDIVPDYFLEEVDTWVVFPHEMD